MVSAGSVMGTSSAITVSPAAAASFAVSAPSTAGAGAGFTVTLTAKDPYGNVVTNYSGSVTLTARDGQPVTMTPATLTWSNGMASTTVTLNRQDTTTLEAAAGSVEGSSSSIVVESPLRRRSAPALPRS